MKHLLTLLISAYFLVLSASTPPCDPPINDDPCIDSVNPPLDLSAGESHTGTTCCAIGFADDPSADFANVVCDSVSNENAVWYTIRPDSLLIGYDISISSQNIPDTITVEIYWAQPNAGCLSSGIQNIIKSHCSGQNYTARVGNFPPESGDILFVKVASSEIDCSDFTISVAPGTCSESDTYPTCATAAVGDSLEIQTLDPFENTFFCGIGCLAYNLPMDDALGGCEAFTTMPTAWVKLRTDEVAGQLFTTAEARGDWTPVWSIYSGTDCSNLTLISQGGSPPCSDGDNTPDLHQTSVLADSDTYWLVISADPTDIPSTGIEDELLFEYCAVTTVNEVICIGELEGGACEDESLVIEVVDRENENGSLDGPFCPGEEVTVHISFVYDATETGADWLKTIIPSFGSGWDMNSLDVFADAPLGNGQPGEWIEANGPCAPSIQEPVPILCTWVDADGVLQLCNLLCDPCSECQDGTIQELDPLPSGFFWSSNAGLLCTNLCNPGTTWGIGSTITEVEWTFTMRVKESSAIDDCEASNGLQIRFQPLSDGVAGCWEDPVGECILDRQMVGPLWTVDCTFPVDIQPTQTSSCSGDTLDLLVLTTDTHTKQIEVTVADNPFVTGEGSGTNGLVFTGDSATINDVLINNSGSIQEVYYTATFALDAALQCTRPPVVLTAYVFPQNIYAADTLCIGSTVQLPSTGGLQWDSPAPDIVSIDDTALATAHGLGQISLSDTIGSSCLYNYDLTVDNSDTLRVVEHLSVCVGTEVTLTAPVDDSYDDLYWYLGTTALVIGDQPTLMFTPMANSTICAVATSTENCTLMYLVEITATPIELKGTAYVDLNQNAVFDDGEPPLSNVQVQQTNSSSFALTDAAGMYTLVSDSGTYDIAATSTVGNWTASELVISDLTVSICTDNLDFGFVPTTTSGSVELYVTSTPALCEQEMGLELICKNIGLDTFTGNIGLDLDPLTTLTNGEAGPISWTVSNLPPYSTTTRSALIQIPSAALESSKLTYSATLIDGKDGTLLQSIDHCTTVTCTPTNAHKSVQPDRKGDANQTLLDESLQYTIWYQNTSTDTIYSVLIQDTVDTNILIESVEVVSSSHPVQLAIADGVLTFEMPDIVLPDSSSNLMESTGYVTFSCTSKSDVELFTIIENSATIYLGDSTMATTNTVISTIVSELCEDIIVSDSTTICEGDSYLGYTEPGTYARVTPIGELGCDSIYTVFLTVVSEEIQSVTLPICEGTTTVFNGITYAEPGMYVDTVLSPENCVSLIYDIFVFTLDIPVIDFADQPFVCFGTPTVLTSTQPGTWTAADPSLLSIAADGTVTALQLGETTVTFTAVSTCISAPLSVIVLDVDDPRCLVHTADIEKPTLSVYPNPVTDALQIEASSSIHLVRLYTPDGMLVLASAPIGASATTLDVGSIPMGLYLLHVQIDNTIYYAKVIVH